MGSRRVVYLLGDSITEGLGSKKVNFTDELSYLLGQDCKVVNLACTGTTIDYAHRLLRGNLLDCRGNDETFCVILYGNVDAQIRPNREGKAFQHIPKRYRGGGMLMPRPFYSHDLRKSVGQHMDNIVRRLLTRFIKLVDGEEQWVHIAAFTSYYAELVESLLRQGICPILCSCIYIDEKLFPKSPRQYELYNEQIRIIAHNRRRPYIDLYASLSERVSLDGWDAIYNKDHFHPNGEGYRLIAERIAGIIGHDRQSCS